MASYQSSVYKWRWEGHIAWVGEEVRRKRDVHCRQSDEDPEKRKEKKRCSSDWDQSHLIEDNPIRPNDKDSRCNRFSSQIQPPPTLTSITRGGKQRKRRWEEFSLTFLHFDHFWPGEEQEVGQTQWYQRRVSLLISERPGNGSGRLTLIHCLYLICLSDHFPTRIFSGLFHGWDPDKE